jgi:hypothetical protein
VNGNLRLATAASLLVLLAGPRVAAGQTITAEADVSAGYSNQDVRAAAAQVRAFGEAGVGVQYFIEAALAAQSGPGTDAFSSAYPYESGVRVIEAYAERLVHRGRLVGGARGGRFRTPFGLYNRGEFAYNGFARAPLIRYDGYFALSNNYLEHGAAGFVGTPHLLAEGSVGAPGDVGEARRRPGVDATVRVQAYGGPVILGLSYIHTQPYLPIEFAFGGSAFTGIDARWMAGGVQLRGEWVAGHPFEGVSTNGGYVDVTVHRREMKRVTAVFRAERLAYDTIPQFAMYARRETAGARVLLAPSLTAQVNVMHQTPQVAYGYPWAVDVGFVYSVRRSAR